MVLGNHRVGTSYHEAYPTLRLSFTVKTSNADYSSLPGNPL